MRIGLSQERASLANPADLAGGIWQALHTTAFGLVVAIPAFIAYNYFVHKVNFKVLEIERATSELTTILTQGKQPYDV